MGDRNGEHERVEGRDLFAELAEVVLSRLASVVGIK